MDDLVGFLRARMDERAEEARAWHDRRCDGCGTSVAARGLYGLVKCTACEPGDLPLTSDRVLTEVEIDRELLREYEQLLRAYEQHKKATAELAADIDHEERTGRWEGVGSPDTRERALRREADYLPAMLHVLEKWAKAKAAIHAAHPDYREEWRP